LLKTKSNLKRKNKKSKRKRKEEIKDTHQLNFRIYIDNKVKKYNE